MGEGLSYVPEDVIKSEQEKERTGKDTKIDEAKYEKARLHYEYARTTGGIDEGEKPGRIETKEADQFIKLLERKEFDFLGIDWQELDLSNLNQVEKAKSRISTALETILQEQNVDKLTMVSFRRNQGRLTLSLLSMMLASTLLTKGVQFGVERSKQMQKIEQIERDKREKITGAFQEFVSDYNKDMLVGWMDKNSEIKNIEIDYLASDGKGNNHRWHIHANARVILHLTNGKKVELKGEAHDGGGENSIFDEATGSMLDAFENKTGLSGGGYQRLPAQEGRRVSFDSVLDALKKYEQTKRINEVNTLLGNRE